MITTLKNNKLLLIAGGILLAYGVFKPDLSNLVRNDNAVVFNNQNYTTQPPEDPALKESAEKLIKIFISGPSSRKIDARQLASLYFDLANLISLDQEDQVIKSTLEIKEANRIAGALFRLNVGGGKYPGLADAANNVVVVGLGDNDVVLDEETRKKAIQTFKALSWACYEGSK
jgi:hypothetical protein